MTYLMRLNQINFGIITPEKDEPSGLNTYSAKHLCLLMVLDLPLFYLSFFFCAKTISNLITYLLNEKLDDKGAVNIIYTV